MSELKLPPTAARKPKRFSHFGIDRDDPYYWMNQRDDPEVLGYLNAENAYTDQVMEPHKPLQDKLYQEMVSRIKPDDTNVPARRGDYFYYRRFEPGQEYPIYCRKKHDLDAPEEVMLDGNKLAEGHDYFEIGSYSVSAKQNVIAYTVDTLGRRIYQIRFLDLETGEHLNDTIEHVDPSLAWAADNLSLFYVRRDRETLRSFQVACHVLGQESAEDRLIFQEDDDTFHLDVFATTSRDFVVIQSFSTLSTEARVLDATMPEGDFEIMVPREENHRYFVDHFGDQFLIMSNQNAVNYKLLECPVTQLGKESWCLLQDHRASVLLEDFHQFENYLVILEREQGLQRIRVIARDSNQEHAIEFDQEVYSLALSRNYTYQTAVLRFEFESMATPLSVFDYHMGNRTRDLLKQEEVVGDFDQTRYTTKRVYAKARDGKEIPMSMVYRNDQPMDGTRPLLLYGYGAYGIKIDPTFRSARLSLLDRGFVYVIAHIRGGADLGRQWYEDGKMDRKKNTFNDFIDCAQHLVDQQYTQKERLFALGGSAGGMLMGVIVNERPDLFAGVIANVPFVDCVTTMQDTSIPLTTGEFDEWGNPAEEKYFRYILDYSPYDQVKAQDYPHLLVIAGLHDSQVQYWEPAKWVAKLRFRKTDKNLLLLHTQMEAGHSGASGRFRRYEEEALQHAFLLSLAGIGA